MHKKYIYAHARVLCHHGARAWARFSHGLFFFALLWVNDHSLLPQHISSSRCNFDPLSPAPLFVFCPSLPFSLLFLVFFLTIYCHCDVTITEESSQSVLMSGYLPIPTVIGPFFFLFGIQPPTCAHNSLRLVVYILATISAVPVQSHYTE